MIFLVSTLVQRPVVERLLPVTPSDDVQGIPGGQFIFEPSPGAVLEQLARERMPKKVGAAADLDASFAATAGEHVADVGCGERPAG